MARNSILKLTDSKAGPSSDPTPDAAQPEEETLDTETEASDECTSVTSGMSSDSHLTVRNLVSLNTKMHSVLCFRLRAGTQFLLFET